VPTIGPEHRSKEHPVFARLFLVLLFLFALPLGPLAHAGSLTLRIDGVIHQVSVYDFDGGEYVGLDDLAPLFGASLLYDEAVTNVVLEFRGAKAMISMKESLATVGDRVFIIEPAPRLSDGRIFVPPGFINRVFGALYPGGAVWDAERHLLDFGTVAPLDVELNLELGREVSTLRFRWAGDARCRVAVDADGARVQFPRAQALRSDFQNTHVGNGVIEDIRFGRLPDGSDGFLVTFGPRFHLHRVREPDRGGELLLELFRSASGADVAIPVPDDEEQMGASPQRSSADSGPRLLHSVVIDPGHGGSESGAVGSTGLMEKDVVLDVASRLARMLHDQAGLEVYLTRESDQLLPLSSRTALANHQRADLFISLHANASTSSGARGSETYFLSAEATDDEARNLAALENRVAAAANSQAGSGEGLEMILWDLAQTEFLLESSRLAERIQEELNRLLNTPNRGIKQAPFRVLEGATMPAVLVEMAFITNPEEELLLLKEAFRERIATALYRSVLAFKRDYETMSRGGADTGRP
jgi:N-acetylmuramoyl-L-alanine amidase